ncbi:MAG: diguanylate cyclase, partial [bacterium]
GEKRDEFWGLQTGADAYLVKPIEPENLIAIIEEVAKKPQSEVRAPVEVKKDDAVEGSDLIFQAGEVQERELFKMTLMNKLYGVSHNTDNLHDTLHETIQLYSSVVHFQNAAFLILDDDLIRMFFFVREPCNREFFQSVKRRMIEDFERQSGKELDLDNAEVILVDPDHGLLKGSGNKNIVDCYSILLEAKGDKYGIYTMGRSRGKPFTHEEIVMVKAICDQSSIVIDNIRMHEKIKRLAVADGLTGLYNHRYFQEQLEKEFSRARRFGLSLSLIMVDIDNFKLINDEHGHQCGDMVLKDLTGILKRSVRDIDTVARYGGEEFVIILPETQKGNARVVAERIRIKVEEYEFKIQEKPYGVSVSVGITGYPDDEIRTRLDFISKADQAMYQAKRGGKNRVCVYSKT